MKTLITCKKGFEKILANEVAFYHGQIHEKGSGWIIADLRSLEIIPCFAYHILENPIKISASSVNNLAEQLTDAFIKHLSEKRITENWPLFFSSSEQEDLIHRVKLVEKCWLEKMQKKMSRVVKLAQKGIPHSYHFADGFFVHFINFDQVFISFKALSAGQQRMQMDSEAPSRSYLKMEEAFKIFGLEPQKNEIVVDLGAAPGGWSYSALKRGAKVTAVDNGPLKGAVKSHHNILHLREDALKFTYEGTEPADWLLCDMIEQPDMILSLLHKWLNQNWCRRFVVNLKIGRTDPIMLLKKMNDPQVGLLAYCKMFRACQLYHDREEITLMGETKD